MTRAVGADCEPAPRVALHADDFGMNKAVSNGILAGFQRGLLTSASVLTNAPYAAPALASWKELLSAHVNGDLPSTDIRRRLDDPPRPFDLGIHLNLTQGKPLTAARYPAELLDQAGCFPGPGGLFRKLHRGPSRYQAEIEAELGAQIEFMLDDGLAPTHLNGHQYVEMMPGIAPLVPRLIQKYSISAVRVPLERRAWLVSFLPGFRWMNAILALIKRFYAARFRRSIEGCRIAHPDAFFGSSHAGCIDLRLFHRFLPAAHRFALAEIALHPACGAEPSAEIPDGWHDPLAAQRPAELQLLLSAELADFFLARNLRLGRISRAA